MTAGQGTVFVLGRDAVGTVAEDRDPGYKDGKPFRYYLTDCCGASAKGCGPYTEDDEGYVGCRACYTEIDPALGGCPGLGPDWEPVPLDLLEVYGDGIPYDEWRARYLTAAPQ